MILVGLLLGVLLISIVIVRQYQMEKRRALMAAQFRASLRNIVHALRVGIGFGQALDYTAKESDFPISSEWQTLVQSLRVGQPLPQALRAFSSRLAMKEARWFATAVEVTQSAGGSLGDVLDSLADTLQERQNLREKIAALTAQGKGSGILMACLPYALIGALALVAPDMAGLLVGTPAGQWTIVGVTASIAVGGFFIKKIVTIEVS
jgi:tight adherence protein B